MKTRTLLTAAALSLLIAAPAALAETRPVKADPAASVDQWFKRYDKDRDGKLTRTEFRLGRTYFVALDIDGDGILTPDEATKALSEQPVEIDVHALDLDKDGYVTRREWTGDQEGFDKLDRDNDGVISQLDRDIEADEARAKNRLASYDKNKDGSLDRSEWPSTDATFRQQDRNRDGKLTVDELGDRGVRK